MYLSSIFFVVIILLTSLIKSTNCLPSSIDRWFGDHSDEMIERTISRSFESDESLPTLSPLIENISNISAITTSHSLLVAKKARAPIVRGLDDFRIQSRGNLRLRCRVGGYPMPRISWWRNGRKLRNSRRISIINKKKSSLLEIRKVRSSLDTGYYECRASNAVVKEPAVARVRVIVTRPVTPTKPTKKPLLYSTTTTTTTNHPVEHSTLSTTTTTSTTMSNVKSISRDSSTLQSFTTNEWQGRPCPISNFCLNGGQCTFYESVGEYVCKCAEGYRGMRCEMKLILVDLYSVFSSR